MYSKFSCFGEEYEPREDEASSKIILDDEPIGDIVTENEGDKLGSTAEDVRKQCEGSNPEIFIG